VVTRGGRRRARATAGGHARFVLRGDGRRMERRMALQVLQRLVVVLLLASFAVPHENQCNEDETAQPVLVPSMPTDPVVASVLNDIHERDGGAACTPQAVRPWP
jgi:hypothetical protein